MNEYTFINPTPEAITFIESNPTSREGYDFCTKELSEELWD